MGPNWDRKDSGRPHVGPMNFAIWYVLLVVAVNHVAELDDSYQLAMDWKLFGQNEKVY